MTPRTSDQTATPAKPPVANGSQTRPVMWIIVTVLVALSVITWLTQRPKTRPNLIAWLADYKLASQQSRQTSQPMLLNFTQEGCGACDRLDYDVFGDERVASVIADRFVPVRVDVTPNICSVQHAELAHRYSVIGTPTLIITDGEGLVISRAKRPPNQPQMLKWLATIETHGATEPIAP